jgi:heterodisulfide reductase subunit C
MDEAKSLLKELLEMPGGDQILKCIQCGTCTGSCPMAPAMDYGPRRLFALAKGGDFEEVFHANTFWICASCYFCTVRCPRDIKITDIMYALKRMAVYREYTPHGERAAAMYGAFKKTVEKYGRLSEVKMMRSYLAKVPFDAFKNASLGMKLISKKRMEFKVEPVKNLSGFRRVLDKARELEGQS